MSRLSLLLAIGAILSIHAVQAHICMWSPMQRGAMAIDWPGEPVCAHKGPSPCGSANGVPVPAGPPLTTLIGGQQFTVEFQQNLNHYFYANPGHLIVEIAKGPNPQNSDFALFGEMIPDYNAMDEISIANMTITGTVPNMACSQCVLRLTYGSNNPLENDTSTNFYQCADITIQAQSDLAIVTELPKPIVSEPSVTRLDGFGNCCTSPQWEANFQTGSTFAPHNGPGYVAFDAINKYFYAVNSNEATGDAYAHFSNYSTGIEWLYDDATGKCSEYGLDFWNNWCYGSDENEVFGQPIVIGQQTVNIYANELADFIYGATPVDPSSGYCTPVVRSRDSTSEITIYYNITQGISDPTIFMAPSVCQATKGWKLSQTGTAEEIAAYASTLERSKSAGLKKQHATKHCSKDDPKDKQTQELQKTILNATKNVGKKNHHNKKH